MALAVIGFSWGFGYYFYLVHVSPTHLDLGTGQIVQMNNHGYLFYVYRWQSLLIDIGSFATVGSFFAVGGLGQWLGMNAKDFASPRWLRWFFYVACAAAVVYGAFGFP